MMRRLITTHNATNFFTLQLAQNLINFWLMCTFEEIGAARFRLT